MAIKRNTAKDAPPLPDPQPEAELADQPATDTELAQEAEEPMVFYHGKFGKREITKEQWETAGIPDQPTVLWERHTGFKVPQAAFGPKALQVLRQDPDFRIS